MTLPSFLIIGAMKAGTTTLFDDLATHPGIFAPRVKEPWALNDDSIFDPTPRARYERLFRRARAGQIAFEASTTYSQLPEITGVPERARRILGSDLRVIYVVRDPIDRVISHHHHGQAQGAFLDSIDEAVRADTRLIDYSRYQAQLEPWIDVLSRERILVVQFEFMVRHRKETVAQAQQFVGLEPRPELIDPAHIANRSEGKRVPSPVAAAIRRSWLYRHMVAPIAPAGARRTLLQLASTRADRSLAPPSDATLDWIAGQLKPEFDRSASYIDLPGPDECAGWDFEESLNRHRRKRREYETAEQSDHEDRSGAAESDPVKLVHCSDE